MGFDLAFLVCAVGVAGLFFLNRDKSVRVSKAVWLPVIWLWINGSRSASTWIYVCTGISFGTAVGGNLSAQMDGSPLDALIYAALLAAGVAVLLRRKQRTITLLKTSTPILIFYAYCFSSIFWSHIPDVAFKRWTKDLGDLAMALVIATDPEPLAALRRVFTRVGFILLPASVLLIRYSPLGRAYDPAGGPVNTGVTTNKNSLGLITFVIAIGAVWSLIQVLRDKRRRNRGRRLVAVGTLIVFGVAVLDQAHSATSIGCFVIGSLLILATHLPFIKRNPAGIHVLVLILLAGGGGMMLFGGQGALLGALGRDSTLTGRTEIWEAVLPMCPNALLGAGFESFWNTYGGHIRSLGAIAGGINEAHNGYIEVYLNLGWLGILLVASILVSAYFRAVAAFRRNPEIGSLMLAYVASTAIYGITEAGFRILTPTWTFLLIAHVTSARYSSRASRAFVTGGTASQGKPAFAGERTTELIRAQNYV
jgi:exopolysaccharide production protein ExoQ